MQDMTNHVMASSFVPNFIFTDVKTVNIRFHLLDAEYSGGEVCYRLPSILQGKYKLLFYMKLFY